MSVRQLDKRPDGRQNSSDQKEDFYASDSHVTCLVKVAYLLLHDGDVLADVLDIRLQHSDVLFPVRHVKPFPEMFERFGSSNQTGVIFPIPGSRN